MTIIDMPRISRSIDGATDSGWVAARIVDVAPHLASVGTFAVHKVADDYRVSNVETGSYIGVKDYATPQGAISYARRYLADVTVEDIERAYRKIPMWVKRGANERD